MSHEQPLAYRRPGLLGRLDDAAARLWLHHQALDEVSMRAGLAVLLEGREPAAVAAEEGLDEEDVAEILHRWHLHSLRADPVDVAAVVARYVGHHGEQSPAALWAHLTRELAFPSLPPLVLLPPLRDTTRQRFADILAAAQRGDLDIPRQMAEGKTPGEVAESLGLEVAEVEAAADRVEQLTADLNREDLDALLDALLNAEFISPKTPGQLLEAVSGWLVRRERGG